MAEITEFSSTTQVPISRHVYVSLVLFHLVQTSFGVPKKDRNESPKECRDDQYKFLHKGKCIYCPKCDPGFGYGDMNCGYGVGSLFECEPCEDGSFSLGGFGSRCQPCDECLNTEVLRGCFKDSNRLCGNCKKGDEFSSMGICLSCAGITDPLRYEGCKSSTKNLSLPLSTDMDTNTISYNSLSASTGTTPRDVLNLCLPQIYAIYEIFFYVCLSMCLVLVFIIAIHCSCLSAKRSSAKQRETNLGDAGTDEVAGEAHPELSHNTIGIQINPSFQTFEESSTSSGLPNREATIPELPTVNEFTFVGDKTSSNSVSYCNTTGATSSNRYMSWVNRPSRQVSVGNRYVTPGTSSSAPSSPI